MSKVVKIESTEDGLNLVLEDERTVKVMNDNSEVSYIVSDPAPVVESEDEDLEESEDEEVSAKKVESVEDLVEELQDEYDIELSEEEIEKLEEAFEDKDLEESEDEKLDESEDKDLEESDEDLEESEDELEESEDEELKESDEDLEESEDEDFKISEELDDLLEIDLDDKIKEKLDVAFDTVVKEKVKKLKEKYAKKNKKQITESIKTLEKAVGIYVEQAAKQYIKNNKIALTEGLRSKYYANFFGKLKTLLKENYIDIPKNGNIVDMLAGENKKLKEKCHSLVESTTKKSEKITRLLREKAINKKTSGMYLTESERFKIAASKLLNEKNLSADEFNSKLEVITEMFSNNKSSSKSPLKTSKVLTESKKNNGSKNNMHPDVKMILEGF